MFVEVAGSFNHDGAKWHYQERLMNGTCFVHSRTVCNIYQVKQAAVGHQSTQSMIRSVLMNAGFDPMILGKDYFLLECADNVFHVATPTERGAGRCLKLLASEGSSNVDELVHELRYNVDVVHEIAAAESDFNKSKT
jgi:hypothetical protein